MAIGLATVRLDRFAALASWRAAVAGVVITKPVEETNEPEPPLLKRTLERRTCLSHSSLGSKPCLALSACLGNWL